MPAGNLARPNRFRLQMTLPRQSLAQVSAALLALAGCQQHAAAPQATGGNPLAEESADNMAAPGSAPLSHGTGAAAAVPAPPAADAPPSPGDPRAPDLVLRQWGTAIEHRDWAAVRALWGHGGADSGVGARHFAARWDRLKHPVVTIGQGTQEGAAGSLYYSAPVTIMDGQRKITGTVTIRRANDVPGATPEQLRWHADAATRAPWTTLH